MNNFYDLNSFFTFILKKVHALLAIIVLCALLFAGFRSKEIYAQYSAQQEAQSADGLDKQSEQISEEPVWYAAGYVVKAKGAEKPLADFIAAASNEQVLDKLSEEYFEIEAKEADNRRELLNRYGYTLDKELKYPYAQVDFRLQATATFDQAFSYVWIEFKSTNNEIAKEIGEGYINLVMEEVKAPKTDYEIMGMTVRQTLPARSEGAIPTRFVGASVGTATIISRSTILTQTIKGAIWGGIGGIIIGLIVLFMWYMMSRKINVFGDVKGYQIAVYGLAYQKQRKGLMKIKKKLENRLEGNNTIFASIEQASYVICADLKLKLDKKEDTVMISSTNTEQLASELADALNDTGKTKIAIAKPNIRLSDKAVLACNEMKQVVLVEKLGKSYKDEIENSIKRYEEYGVQVLGVLCIE